MLIDWFTVAAQAANFLILVWLLKRFLYKPVLAAVDQREKKIASQLRDAEEEKTKAVKEQADFARKSEEFDLQRSALLTDAANAAKTEREKLLATARQDGDMFRSKLQAASEAELAGLNEKVRSLVQEEVFSVSKKALADLAEANLEECMTGLFIRRLDALKDTERKNLIAALQLSPALVRSAFEVSPSQKAAIEEAVRQFVPGVRLEFETRTNLICGVELAVGGSKIGWNVEWYLAGLEQSMQALVKPASEQDTITGKVLAHAA